MPRLSSKRVAVYDHGGFVPLACKLAQYFDTCYYYTPWKTAIPKQNRALIGDGLKKDYNVIRVREFWEIVKETDLFVFPDVLDGDLQVFLEKELGKRVWGSREAEDFEQDRYFLKRLQEKEKMPFVPYERIIGLDKLSDYLKTVEDRYIKISRYRGDMETWHHVNWRLSETTIDALAQHLGTSKSIKEFIVEESIPTDAEGIGYDGWTVDGFFPAKSVVGFEVKDAGLIGAVRKYEDLPEQVRSINTWLAPHFKKFGYRGFFSDDIRIGKKDKLTYLTDPTCRMASPPGELYIELFSNWDEIIWYGSEGELVPPTQVAKFGVQAKICCQVADKDWTPIDFPKSITRWVKLNNVCQIKGQHCIIPQETEDFAIGSLVAIDDTILGAVKKIKGYAKQVEGIALEIKLDSLGQAIRDIDKAQKAGIKFSDSPLPKVEEIEAI